MNPKYYIFFLFYFYATLLSAQEKIKVACVGNSVTFGYGIEDKCQTYPKRLQKMLGDGYEVQNFGHSGATLLKKGHNPYWKLPELEQAIAFEPDIVIIHLGLNDTDPRNWARYRDDFTRDYIDLIDVFTRQSAEVFICRMTPIFHRHSRFKSSTRDWFWQIQQAIETIATTQNVKLIDLHSRLHKHPELFPDALHPNAEGAKIIAEEVYKTITGDYGGLKLATIFSDAMVLQRNKPIKIWGTANAGTTVTVTFNQQRKRVETSYNGHWEVVFPQMVADGKPYELVVENQRDKLEINNILIGDVWIASGQSNMEFPLKNALTGTDDILTATYPNIRLYNKQPFVQTTNTAWADTVLEKVNQLEYFLPTQWQEASPKTVKDFSAIAYYFAKKIYEETNIPIGIIHNAVGGSPTEAWIGRMTIEHHPRLVDMLYDWNTNDYINPWCRERGKKNMENSKNPLQRHPYQPAYLFESGMIDLVGVPIAGVIWYQGESNAHNVELHEIVLPVLVENWRNTLGNSDFPFYYVQLSSMEKDRQTWGHFRDSQRRLLNVIPNSGMVVSSDVGDRTNVHPIHKKPVGERLARLALADYYKKNNVQNSPFFTTATFNGQEIIVSFQGAKQLKTSDKLPIRGFEVAGNDKVFYVAKATLINNNKVKVISETITNPTYVRYGWSSFSDGNLVNEENLPASTFSTEY